MSSGLLALLDDIAAIVKASAGTIDDIAAGAIKASSKAAGVVIDDTAVTPKYVVGLSPARELPIVWNIAKGSLKNKLLILLPAMLLLGAVAPWSVNPLLAIGGLFLCFEGYEKLHHAVHSYLHPAADTGLHHEEAISPEELEKIRTAGAIRTDFILSAEIMAIAYSVVKADTFMAKLAALVVVAVAITAGVYGVVALILKADDAGLRLAKPQNHSTLRKLGRALVLGMPFLLQALSVIGTAAMLWVGGGIILHSIPPLHHQLQHVLDFLNVTGIAAWACEASICLIFAIIIGWLVVLVVRIASGLLRTKQHSSN